MNLPGAHPAVLLIERVTFPDADGETSTVRALQAENVAVSVTSAVVIVNARTATLDDTAPFQAEKMKFDDAVAFTCTTAPVLNLPAEHPTVLLRDVLTVPVAAAATFTVRA